MDNGPYTTAQDTTYARVFAATGDRRAAYRAAHPFTTAIGNLDRLDGQDRDFLADLLAA